MEKGKIIQTVTAIFDGADERDWEKIRNSFADNLLLDYSSLSGNPAKVTSATEIIDTWKSFLPGFDKTDHQLSNFRINESGNSAIVHFDGKADHFLDKEVWTVEGSYDAEVLRKDDRWIVTALKFNFLNQSGFLSLPAKAIERMSEKSQKE